MTARAIDDPRVTVPEDVAFNCRMIGFTRYVKTLIDRKSDPTRTPEHDRTPYDHIVSHMQGAIGEWVCCSHIGVRWPALIDGYGTPDLEHNGIRYEFRTTLYADGRLICHPTDPVDIWVLVVASSAHYRIAGYADRVLAADPAFRRGSNGDSWIPQTRLYPLPVGGVTPGKVYAHE